jgi:ABC-type transporter Mla subunit MlaD
MITWNKKAKNAVDGIDEGQDETRFMVEVNGVASDLSDMEKQISEFFRDHEAQLDKLMGAKPNLSTARGHIIKAEEALKKITKGFDFNTDKL